MESPATERPITLEMLREQTKELQECVRTIIEAIEEYQRIRNINLEQIRQNTDLLETYLRDAEGVDGETKESVIAKITLIFELNEAIAGENAQITEKINALSEKALVIIEELKRESY